MSLEFTEDSYTVDESNGSVSVCVRKNSVTAEDVPIVITPFETEPLSATSKKLGREVSIGKIFYLSDICGHLRHQQQSVVEPSDMDTPGPLKCVLIVQVS